MISLIRNVNQVPFHDNKNILFYKEQWNSNPIMNLNIFFLSSVRYLGVHIWCTFVWCMFRQVFERGWPFGNGLHIIMTQCHANIQFNSSSWVQIHFVSASHKQRKYRNLNDAMQCGSYKKDTHYRCVARQVHSWVCVGSGVFVGWCDKTYRSL